MTIQSKATKIDAENYVQIKQEANAKQTHNANFGPFQPKKSITTLVSKKHDPKALPLDKRFMSRTFKTSTNTPAQDPATSLVPTVTKKHDPKALPLNKRFMSRTFNTSTNIDVHWKENIDVDPDEVVQVEGIHT